MDCVAIVQLIPSYEYANTPAPELMPPATHIFPFQQAPCPDVLKIVVPNPLHCIPSYEYAIVFVPVPSANVGC